MTREEAIKELKILREDYWDEYGDTMPALDMAIKALEQQPSEDCISRQAVDELSKELVHTTRDKADFLCNFWEGLRKLPPVQPKYNTSEWCHDCKEYDQNKHCCPRLNRVIRNAVEEAKKTKVGHWVKTLKEVMGEGYMWYCDKCERQVYQDSSRPYPSEKYCPNCGAKMIEPQESEDKE